MKPFDPTKPVQYRDGVEAHIIYAEIVGSKRPIVCIRRVGEEERLTRHTLKGYRWSGNTTSPTDLINVPKVRKGWAIIHRDTCNVNFRVGSIHKTHEDALKIGEKYTTIVAVIPIEFEEGEGLDET